MIVSTAMRTAMKANIAIDVQGRIRSLCAKRAGGDARARPRPLKVEAADAAVDVEDLADEPQSRAHTRRHRRWIDLVERHAAGSGFRVVVAAVADDVQRPRGQR